MTELTPRTESLRAYYENVDRSHTQMQKDLAVAFDHIQDLKRRVDNLKNWGKFLTLALSFAGGLIVWLANHLYECVQLAGK